MFVERFTKEEKIEIKEYIIGMKGTIHKGNFDFIWDNYRKLTDTKEPSPNCTCGGVMKHWEKAVTALWNMVKEVDNVQGN